MPLDHRTQQPRPSKAHDHSYRPAAASDWTDPDPKTVGSALDDLHQLLYETVHAGALEAISVVDEGGINVSWGAGKVYTPDRVIQETDASDGPQACTDNAINYLVWLAGAGSTLALQTSVGDPATDICLGHIKVQDGDIWEVHIEPIITATVPAIQAGLMAIMPKIVSDGLLVSEDADATNPLDVSVEAGTYWHDAHDLHEIAQYDTRTANTLVRCYIDGSGPETWDFTTGQHSIDVANWNSGTALIGTAVGKYYRGMFLVSEDNVFWLYGQTQYNTLAEAIAGANPSVPAGIDCFPASVVYIYKHGDVAFDTAGSNRWIDVRPRIGVAVPGSVTSHDELTDVSADDHHAETHTIVSHDTTATGANLTTLTDGSSGDGLHSHTAGGGDVVGPAGATDHAITRYDTATGKLIQDSALTVSDAAGDSVTIDYASASNTTLVFSNSGAGTLDTAFLGNLGVLGDITVTGTVDTVDVAALSSAYTAHAADTSDPHGASMSVSVKVTTPKIDNAGNLVFDATNAAAHSSASVENSDSTYKAGLKVEGNAGVGRKDHGTVSSSPLSINWLEGNLQTLTLGINLTINFGTAPLVPTTGMAFCYLKITNGAGTAYTVTFGDVDGWGSQETFVMSTGLGDIDIITICYDGTNYWAVPFGQNFGL